MPSTKVFSTAADAVADIPNGSTLMVAGHRGAGAPEVLVRALLDAGVTDLTCICGPWDGGGAHDASMLVARGRVRRLVTAPPARTDPGGPAIDLWRSGGIEVEVVSPGTLAERIRAAGAGLGGILLPMEAVGSAGGGLETRNIEGAAYALEAPWPRTSRCSTPGRRTPWATWSTGGPNATGTRSWPPPPGSR